VSTIQSKSEGVTEPQRPKSTFDYVLIAEDDAISRKILQNWLKNWGYQVIIAEDGAKAGIFCKKNLRPNCSFKIG